MGSSAEACQQLVSAAQIDFGPAPGDLPQGSEVQAVEEAALFDGEEALLALPRGLVALLTAGEEQKGTCHLSGKEVREMVGIVQKIEEQVRELADKVGISF